MINFLKYCSLSFLLLLLLAACKQEGRMPSLKETYSQKDKIPFGSFVFFNQLQLLFNQNAINTKKINFEKFWHENADTNSLYITITKNLFLSKADEKAMLNFVADGNTIFISSQHIDSTLLDSLGCKVALSSPLNETLESIKNTAVSVGKTYYSDSGTYSYFYFPFVNHFTTVDTVSTNVLGINDVGPNYIEIVYGRGRFYLHCEPRAFSNYFLLQNKNYQYLQNVFAFNNRVPDHLYWDDFYNKRNFPSNGKEGKSGLSLLLQYPSMAWAFWLVLILVGLYIFFGAKRRQRIVPAIVANLNTTIAFTETIGNLYLQKKDNRNIADKMILYFYEHLRKQYFLNTSQLNEDLIIMLSKKSNVGIDVTRSLFNLIEQVQQQGQISDEQLLILNNKIDNFYLNKK